MKKCVICKETKALSEFNKKNSSKDGLQNVCRECNKGRSRQYYSENKEHHRKVIKERTDKARRRNREFLVNYLKTHPCVDCGETDIRVLEFDHVRGIKIDGVGRLAAYHVVSIKRLQEEIDKCEVRCKNHHTIVTYERLGRTWHDDYMGL